jgi:PHD finger protein 20
VTEEVKVSEIQTVKIESEKVPAVVEIKRKTVSRKSTPLRIKAIAIPSPDKNAKKTSKRLSAKLAAKPKIKLEASEESPEKPKAAPPTPSSATPKKKNQVVNFVPGSSIEAQNFDGKWIPVKVIEVDMDEREVLVRSCDKNNKSKTGINDEWISMDSPRLRPAQPIVTFEVGEKVLARWNDCRKFPATVKRVLDNGEKFNQRLSFVFLTFHFRHLRRSL